ncbi:MAG: pyroglutamyl-peptidase I [Pseudolabrys sp.]|nr:pyroglutamyl-peptidase I [Pseudolabrys sp.]
MMALTILVTGFGPFPGAPFNPTGPLVMRLARVRRPVLARAKIVPHIFQTSYASIDRDLPELIARHRPDALLMFGLAPRTRTLRIETRARNTLALLPDASGASLKRGAIAPGRPAALAMPAPARRLLAAIRATGVPAVLSRDAGHYLCNYLCWRAADAATKKGGPRLAAFVHVPNIPRGARRPAKRRKLTLDDLTCVGSTLLATVTSACHD